MTAETLTRIGTLMADDRGQLVFRLQDAQCSTCNASCVRRGVRELVVPSASPVKGFRQSVLLHWTRRELSSASLRVYGSPVVGLLLAVTVSSLAHFPDSMAAIVVFAGMFGGMLVAKLLELVWQPLKAPEVSFQPFNNDE